MPLATMEKTIDEWAAQMRQALENFVADVKRGQAEKPDQWPMSAGAGDWDEWFWNHDGGELGG